MTTDQELLADITDKHNNHIEEHTQIVLINGCITCKVYYALRAVMDLFPTAGNWNGTPVISVESLRQAITKELQ